MCALNKKQAQYGLTVAVQARSIQLLNRILEQMKLEPIAFEKYIPEIKHLIKRLRKTPML